MEIQKIVYLILNLLMENMMKFLMTKLKYS